MPFLRLMSGFFCLALVVIINQAAVSAEVKKVQVKTTPLPASSLPSAKAAKSAKPQWAISCSSIGPSAKLRCKMTQQVFLKKTRQRILAVTISKPAKKGEKAAMLFSLPHGLYLPNGIQLRIDESPPRTYPIQASNADGVYAAAMIDNQLLANLKSGSRLVVSLVTSNKKTLNIPVELTGFMAAYERTMSLE